MIAKRKFIFSLLITCCFFACNDNDDTSVNNPSDNFTDNFGSQVSRDFFGQIVDQDSHGVANVTVKIGSTSVQTDSRGIFIIKQASVYQNFAYITAHKAGYVDGSRAMVPLDGANNVKIMLYQDIPTATVQSGTSSEVTMYAGTKVVFDGAFEDENGNAYTGDVAVTMFHLMPSDPNLSALMPGMLYAEDENGGEKVLKTFGMLRVELKGTGGQKLQIAEGHTAQVTIRIDPLQLADAPQTIPLWHFDEAGGYWKQEGSATKTGNTYVGTVSHFSWWNCDAPFSTVILTTSVTDTAGNPLAGVNVMLGTVGTSAGAITNQDGFVSGLVPANEVLTMTVHNACGEAISTSQIGPFATDTVLPPVAISSSTVTPVTVIGSLKNCNSQNITSGYIVMKFYGTTYTTEVINGNFSFDLVTCSNDDHFTLEGVDYVSQQSTGTINYDFTPGTTNVGDLLTCDAVDEFISYQIDDNPAKFIIGSVSASIDGGLFISGSNPPQANYVTIYGSPLTTGTFNSPLFTFISYEDFGMDPVNPNYPPDQSIAYTISNFGATGEYIDMTFIGTANDSVNATHTIHGNLHIKRNN